MTRRRRVTADFKARAVLEAQLGVRYLAAYSPEARGRPERILETLPDRLVKGLADAGIVTIAAADRFIRETYLPAHNAHFAVVPTELSSAFML